jgi:hypothetical protein
LDKYYNPKNPGYFSGLSGFSGATGPTTYPGTGVAVSTGTAWGTSLVAASANTASALVQRDGSGNFTAGTITAALTGNASGSAGTVTGNATGSTFGFNSGYGSVATAYGCRAWVNFNGTGTIAIRASGNVTSITDNAVGDYTVNFTTAMPDVNYSIVGSAGSGNAFGSYGFNNPGAGTRFAVGSCRINSFIAQSATLSDVDTVCVSVFR